MKIEILKKSNKPKHKKDGRINPHNFWMFFIIVFLILIIIAILWLTYFFITSSRFLDKDAIPKMDTNANQIRKIEQSIKNAEDAISTRENTKDN